MNEITSDSPYTYLIFPILMSFGNCNAIMNFLIYSIRHRDMRLGIK